MTAVGPVGRLGAWTADHFRAVLVAWIVVAVGLGCAGAAGRDGAFGCGLGGIGLAVGAGAGADRPQLRWPVERRPDGRRPLARTAKVGDPPFTATVDRVAGILRADSRVASVALPRAGFSISQDGHTAIVSAGAKGSTTEMVAAADDLKGELKAAGSGRRAGEPDRRLRHVVGLQRRPTATR